MKPEIKAGWAFLSQEYGEDWPMRIDLRRFDLSNCRHCLLGQLDASKDYYMAVDRLFDGSESQAMQYAFQSETSTELEEFHYEWVDGISAEQDKAVREVQRGV